MFLFSTLVVICFVSVMICLSNILLVAYFTLQERQVLAATQLRKGPNFVGFLGLAQPLSDASKLLLKELVVPKRSNYFIFVSIPGVMLMLSISLWALFPLSTKSFVLLPQFALLFPIVLSSLNVLLVILIGWSSNSKYAFQGAMRCIAQLVSYELSFTIVLLSVLVFYGSLEILSIVRYQTDSWGVCNLLTFIVFYITVLGEANRTPFDLAEAESELVSGYNTEHSSVLFTYMFLAEYCYMVVPSNILVIPFLGGWLLFDCFLLPSWFVYGIKLLFILYIFIWVRATLPRYRYDQLMYLGWTLLLPLSLGLLALHFFKIFLIKLIVVVQLPW